MTGRRERTVLTTGANSGIGLATAVHLATLGFRSVGSVRTQEKAAAVLEAAANSGASVDTVLLDVTDAQGCAAVIDELHPWAIVNNAGYPGVGAVEDVGDDEARRQLESMVVAPVRLARLALPHMRAAGGGRIVNVSSIYGFTTTPFSGWYQACKHALEAVSDALRLEVAGDGIRVVLVEPGGVKTGIWREFEEDVERRAGSHYEGGYERARTLLTLCTGWMGEPENVARAIGSALTARTPRARYLIGPDARALAVIQPFVPTRLRDRITRAVAGL